MKCLYSPGTGQTFPEVMTVILSYARTILLYLVLVFVIRLLGKRQIGEMEPMEFVVTMLIANLAAIPMQDGAIPLLSGLVPILTVLGAELVLSGLALRSMVLRRILCGKPILLIENGKILVKNLQKTRITLDELTGHLRTKDVLDPTQVQYAILETNGELSVFPYPEYTPASAGDAGIPVPAQHLPVAVISDGKVLGQNLRKMGHDSVWLKAQLRSRNLRQEQVLLLTVDETGSVICIPKEGQP